MANWTLSLDAEAVLKRLDTLVVGFDDRTKLHEKIVITWQQRVIRSWPTGPELSEFTYLTRKGQAILQDTGHLRLTLTGANPQSISNEDGTLNAAEKTVSTFGSKLPYARVQNDGAIIDAIRAKYLALPMTRQAKEAGSPRNFDGVLALWPLKNGQGFYLVDGEPHVIVRGKNKGKTVNRPVKTSSGYPTAHYLLKKSVEIPARRFFPTPQEALEDAGKVGRWWLRALLGSANESVT